MGRNIFRQDTQIRKSETYTDNIAPSETNYETNAANINDDLNSLRSQAHNLLKNQAGKWYDDLNIPATLETGSQRGVNDLNSALHLIEKKRVLRDVTNVGVDIVVPAAAKATGVLNSTGAFSDGETVTITGPGGARTYTFKSPFVNSADNIDASGTRAQTHENLRRAINGDGVEGTNYGTGTVTNADVSATDTATSTTVTAKLFGSFGNAIAVATSCANASWTPTGYLGGGAGDIVILAAGELPDQDTAAVGVVATLGTVVAQASPFAAQSLAEVAGGTNALSPRNLMMITDATTGDPILSSGRQVWGLFQSESATNPHTMTDTSPTRVQITFVRPNATFDDLEFVPYADITGKTINYTTRERVRLEDLTEFDFLRGAVVDVGSGSGVIDRQHAYDNQGTTPVEVATNSTLDLNAVGIHWTIRDKLNADLFDILEGTTGGTTEITFGSAVDKFTVDAILNDFDNGIAVDTGSAGTKIQIGVTANQIDSGGALNIQTAAASQLKLTSGGQLALTDKWEPVGWSLDGVQLSDSAQEWTDFETAFGEVSLLKAITMAAAAGGIRKVHATVTAVANAGVDVSLADANVDTAWGDLSIGTFVDDYDVYVNGAYNRPAAGATADVYPGSTMGPPQGKLKFTYKLHIGDEIALFDRAA